MNDSGATSQAAYTRIRDAVYVEVERACAASSNSFGYGIWAHHIVWVVQYGLELADTLGADRETVELAALLHDYAGIKDVAFAPEHHRHGVREAGKLLSALSCPAAQIAAVQHCILTHRASQGLEPTTPEAVCLASADAMAHIAQVPSLLHLAYVGRGLDIAEGADWVRAKLERSFDKLCPEAKMLIGARYQAALDVLRGG